MALKKTVHRPLHVPSDLALFHCPLPSSRVNLTARQSKSCCTQGHYTGEVDTWGTLLGGNFQKDNITENTIEKREKSPLGQTRVEVGSKHVHSCLFQKTPERKLRWGITVFCSVYLVEVAVVVQVKHVPHQELHSVVPGGCHLQNNTNFHGIFIGNIYYIVCTNVWPLLAYKNLKMCVAFKSFLLLYIIG